MRVYFIRHGQTTANLAGTHQGWGPIGLTELGFEQARAAREYVGRLEFDRYYGSDLLRTRQTAETVFPDKFHAGEIIFDEDLREIDTGAYYGCGARELERLYGEEFAKRRAVMDIGAYGMESSEHIKARVGRFKSRLEQDYDELPDGRLAVVAHGGIIRAFTLLVCGIDPTDQPCGLLRMTVDNCSVSVYDYTPEKGWTIKALNFRPDILG